MIRPQQKILNFDLETNTKINKHGESLINNCPKHG